jgi:hypothetical protein
VGGVGRFGAAVVELALAATIRAAPHSMALGVRLKMFMVLPTVPALPAHAE